MGSLIRSGPCCGCCAGTGWSRVKLLLRPRSVWDFCDNQVISAGLFWAWVGGGVGGRNQDEVESSATRDSVEDCMKCVVERSFVVRDSFWLAEEGSFGGVAI